MTANLQFFNIIDGKPNSGAGFERCIDPRTEEPLWEVAVAAPGDLDKAVAAATKAFKDWSKTTILERQDKLRRIAESMRENSEVIKDYLMKETGKTRLMGEIEILAAMDQTQFCVDHALKDEIVFEDADVKILQTHAPLGTVGAICPWNFPIILSNIKIISSLITGNCVIVKPSPFTPYAVIKTVELFQSFLPPGVLQVLNGGADLGAAMTSHPGIHKITFTGTTATGKRVMESCASTLKKVTLELAGNNASIVCDDVDIPTVAAKIASGGFFNAGQVCVATKRVYVPESIFDKFVTELEKQVRKGFQVQTDQESPAVFGPLSNKMQYAVVQKIFDDCRKNGYDMRSLDKVPEKGFWLPPTIVVNPPQDSMVVQQEQFGPILPIISYRSIDEALRHANLANSGLGASVYSNDLVKAESIARRIESGSVWINVSERPHHGAFFSGWKDSGFGGEMGARGLLSYTYTQSLLFNKERKSKL